MNLQPFTPKKLRRRLFSQLWMLGLQFVLGMLLNLIGSEAPGALRTVYVVVLAAHILNAIGLVEGGLYVVLKERSALSRWTLAALAVTFAGGVLTVRTGQDIWSFVMACGFLTSAGLTGVLYVQADRRVQSSGKPAPHSASVSGKRRAV